jgi:hypothetical protein
MQWVIVEGPIDHSEPGVDGRGWLWQIQREEEQRGVFVEVSGTALSSDPTGLARETAEAIATRGGAALDHVLDLDEPPGVIRCTTTGCTYEGGSRRGAA